VRNFFDRRFCISFWSNKIQKIRKNPLSSSVSRAPPPRRLAGELDRPAAPLLSRTACGPRTPPWHGVSECSRGRRLAEGLAAPTPAGRGSATRWLGAPKRSGLGEWVEGSWLVLGRKERDGCMQNWLVREDRRRRRWNLILWTWVPRSIVSS
jgi:hypothetical protein